MRLRKGTYSAGVMLLARVPLTAIGFAGLSNLLPRMLVAREMSIKSACLCGGQDFDNEKRSNNALVRRLVAAPSVSVPITSKDEENVLANEMHFGLSERVSLAV